MKYTVSVFDKHYLLEGNRLFRGSYSARTKIGAYLKAFWNTRFEWSFYNYYLDT